MKEASKTNAIRPIDFAARYLDGTVLDIGAGDDPICAHAQIFDQQHGDANHIDRYFAPGSFDTVHSSHSLEHMVDPVAALAHWWILVKPKGHLILVVPDEDLYEQGLWPSFFNDDHKSSFRLGKEIGLSPVSFDIGRLCMALPQSEVLSATVQDHHLDRRSLLPAGTKAKRLRHPLKLLASIVKRINPAGSDAMSTGFGRWLVRRGYPIDQTNKNALAQIEVIVKKLPE